MTRLSTLFFVLAAAACGTKGATGDRTEATPPTTPAPKGTTQMTPTAKRWTVHDGSTLVLEVSSVPGPILSTAAPPPGLQPVTHPFLSASARSATHEHKLRELLVASKDLPDFLARLRAASFDVREVP